MACSDQGMSRIRVETDCLDLATTAMKSSAYDRSPAGALTVETKKVYFAEPCSRVDSVFCSRTFFFREHAVAFASLGGVLF
jgi:hypothetical protein